MWLALTQQAQQLPDISWQRVVIILAVLALYGFMFSLVIFFAMLVLGGGGKRGK